MDAALLRRIVAQVNAAHPDIVLLAGDMVIGHDASGADARAAGFTAPLAGLRAPMGVVAVLGNHDHWTASAAIRAALALAGPGIAALSNDALRRVPIALLGVDDRYSGHADVAATWPRGDGSAACRWC